MARLARLSVNVLGLDTDVRKLLVSISQVPCSSPMAQHGAPRAAVRLRAGPAGVQLDTDVTHGNLIINEMRGCTRELRASGKQMVRDGILPSKLIRQEDCSQIR